ncbi:hypothetical protein [Pedobacter caeni]
MYDQLGLLKPKLSTAAG